MEKRNLQLTQAEGNCKRKGDCLECKTPSHLHNFPFTQFVDRLATDEYPITTRFLGYESKEKKSRTLFRKPLEKQANEGDIHITPAT